MKKNKNLLKKQGFTLVELIIVIAIIAVLAVAAFMMLTKWLGKSRDSRRLSDLGTIQKWLEVGYSDEDMWNGLYPDILEQTGAILLYSWDDTQKLAYQGIVDLEVSKSANLQKTPLDPSDGNEYTYLVTSNRKKFQVMAMLEDGTETTVFVDNVFALDYSNRVATVRGFDIWVLLEVWTNLPIQYWTEAWTWLNLSDDNILDAYKAKRKDGEDPVVGIGIQELEVYTQTPVVETPAPSIVVTPSCDEATKPEDNTHIIYTINPSSENQAYVKDSWECGYECKDNYTGTYCTTAPDINTVLMMHADTDFNDSSTKSNNGIAYLDASLVTSKAWFGNAMSFDGVGDFVEVPDSTDFDFAAGNFTIDTWVKYDNLGVNTRILWQYESNSPDGNSSWLLYLNNNKIKFLAMDTLGVTATTISSTTIATWNWYHIAIARSWTSVKLFINWKKESEYTGLWTIRDKELPLIIWAGYKGVWLGDYNMDGYIDELRISKGIDRTTEIGDNLYVGWTCNIESLCFAVPTAPY